MAKDDVTNPTVISGNQPSYNADQGLNEDHKDQGTDGSLVGIRDEATLPKGTVDPVYEAKARVLNHAVWAPSIILT